MSSGPACVPPTSGVPVPSPLKMGSYPGVDSAHMGRPKAQWLSSQQATGKERVDPPHPGKHEDAFSREHCVAREGLQHVPPSWARSVAAPLCHVAAFHAGHTGFRQPPAPRKHVSPNQSPLQLSLSICKFSDSFISPYVVRTLASAGEAWGSKAESLGVP